MSEVDAEGEVFGDAAETPKLMGKTLPLPIHEPFTQREAENEVSEDTLETLSKFEVNAEGEVLGHTAETPEPEGTTLPLPIHKSSTQREAKNEVSEDTLETQTESKVDIVKTEIEAARGCTKLHETAQGPVETV